MYFIKTALLAAIAVSSPPVHVYADADADEDFYDFQSEAPVSASLEDRRALYAAMQEHRRLNNEKGNGRGKGPPIVMPGPSQQRLAWLKEKKAKATINDPYAVGLVEEFSIDAGTTEEVCVVAEGSDGVRIHVQAPPGAEAYAICHSNEEASKLDFGDAGDIWSPTCPGEEICLQVMSESSEGDVQITEHTYVPSHESESIPRKRLRDGHFRRLESLNCPLTDYQTCLVNADCYQEADPLRDATAAYLYIKDGATYSCSGALIKSATTNPLFLTAAHCIQDSTTASTMDFYGGAVLPCGDSCTSNFLNLPTTWRATGSIFRLRQNGADRTLVAIANPDLKQYALDWTNEVVPVGENLIAVGHSKGGPLSFSTHVTKDKICSLSPDDFMFTDYGLIGAQGGGSSGGVAVNSNLQIVGQIFGTCDATGVGGEYCDIDLVFGRLSARFGTGMQNLLGPPPTPAPTAATPAPSSQPTNVQTAEPTPEPTPVPSSPPTNVPTAEPTPAPSSPPTNVPTAEPTPVPSSPPTNVQIAEPTSPPTPSPTVNCGDIQVNSVCNNAANCEWTGNRKRGSCVSTTPSPPPPSPSPPSPSTPPPSTPPPSPSPPSPSPPSPTPPACPFCSTTGSECCGTCVDSGPRRERGCF